MTVFLEEHGSDDDLMTFQRVSLAAVHSESWLQGKLFQHASVILASHRSLGHIS